MTRGRKLNKAAMARAVEAIRKGCTYKLAANAAGVSESSIYRWLREADNGAKRFVPFAQAVRAAENERAEFLLDAVCKAAHKDWRSAAFLLERRYGYRKNVPLDEPKPEASPVAANVDARTLLVQQSAQLQEAMLKASQAHSWQAYAALQRQFVSVIEQIRGIDAQDEQLDGFDAMNDEQLLAEMEAAVLAMPPVMRQRLQQRIIDTQKVIPINAQG